MKLDDLTKKEYPAQQRERLQLTLDTVRANQDQVGLLLMQLVFGKIESAGVTLRSLHKQDRDALLLPNGSITEEQIKALGSDQKMESVDGEDTSSV